MNTYTNDTEYVYSFMLIRILVSVKYDISWPDVLVGSSVILFLNLISILIWSKMSEAFFPDREKWHQIYCD